MVLTEVAEILAGGILRGNDFSEQGSIIVLSLRNLRENNKLILTKTITVGADFVIRNRLLRKGDIVIACTVPMGSICNMFLFDLPIKATVSHHLAIIRPRNGQENLFERLNHNYYHLKVLVKTRHNILRISLNDLRNFELKE